MKVHKELDNEAAQIRCTIARCPASASLWELPEAHPYCAKPVVLCSVEHDMNNTDWKGRVSKLYDQIAGNVHVLQALPVAICFINRQVARMTYAGLLCPGHSRQ